MKSFLVLLAYSFLLVESASANVCAPMATAQDLHNQFCTRNERDGLYRQQFTDGTFLPNPDHLREQFSSQKRNVNTDVQHRQKLGQAWARLISSMILQVTAGKPETEWNDHQVYIVNKLRNLRVRYSYWDDCDHEINATYSSEPNEIRLCPIFSHMPVEATLAVFAHELGHLVDPCLYSTVNGPNPKDQGSDKEPLQPGLDAMVNTCFADNCRMTSVSRPDSYFAHPYINAAICTAANFPNQSDLDPGVRRKTREDGDYFPGGARPILPNASVNRRSASCSRQTSEAFADSVQASLIQFHLEQNPNEVPPERRMLLTYTHQADLCMTGDGPNPQYPRFGDRLRNILQIPAIRSQTGCEVEEIRPICGVDRGPIRARNSPPMSSEDARTNDHSRAH